MRLSTFLDSSTIVLRPGWSTFEDTVRGLTEALHRGNRLPGPLAQKAVEAVCEREQLSSTSIVEINVSIPHARIEGMEGVAVALAASPDSLYETEAGVGIAITALVLSAPKLAAQHLSALSALSLLLQSDSIRQSLLDAADPEEVMALVRTFEGP